MSKKWLPALFLFAIVIFPLVLRASVSGVSPSTTGTVAGTVKDASGAALQGAQVVLQPGAVTATSDAQGAFLIPNLKPGTYTATISYVGFTTATTSITVTVGQTAPLDTTLTVGSANAQVQVTAEFEGDAAAINEQRVSENILNVQTDTQIQSLPNAN